MFKPRLVILAGPNGAGKTTVSKYLLPEAYGITEFVNADRIAAGLSAFAPEAVAFEAGRIILKRIDALLKQKASFAFETTLTSKAFTKLIARAQGDGYHVALVLRGSSDRATRQTPRRSACAGRRPLNSG